MFAEWRFTLRKAEHALKLGHLEKAGQIVSSPDVRSYRQAQELRDRVAAALATRAEDHLRRGDSDRAWNDLVQAESLDGSEKQLGKLRQELVQHALNEATGYLRAAQPHAALGCLVRLQQHGVDSADARKLREGAAVWQDAEQFARAGRFRQAIERFEDARTFLPDCPALAARWNEAVAACESIAAAEPALHRAVASKDWQGALAQADEILAIAPEHIAARAARRQAWQAIGIPVTRAKGGPRVFAVDPHRGNGDDRTVIRPQDGPIGAAEDRPAETHAAAGRPDERFLLWIDAVGGYLVCLGDHISIGQPAGWHVDVPIMADLSRLHAWIERDGEGYLLRAVRPATINGRLVPEQSVLNDRDLIALGQGTRLRFRRPTPLSRTARLEIESPHRLSLPAQAVVLMAETLVIGPPASAHIAATEWNREVVLYRRGGELWCRTPGEFEVDGQTCCDRARLSFCSRIAGDGFSLALEPLVS